MKKLLTLGFLLIFASGFSQPWMKNLPKKDSKGQITFFDYQKAFNDYWEPLNVDNKAYYLKNGKTTKAAGWKQFKRWEYNMEGQINAKTGAFPTKTAQQIYDEYKKTNTQKGTKAASWSLMGPSSSLGGYAGVGRINCIAFHPSDNNTYWVGAPCGGLWVTNDNGSSWTCLTDNNSVLGISDIVIPSDYASSNTIYIATGDRDAYDNYSVGVLKSTDGGTTWNTTGLNYSLSSYKLVTRLLLDPNDDNTIIASTNGGVYKTTNGGSTWSTQLSSNNFIDMEYKPGDFSTLYGSTKTGDIYVSTNSGSNWSLALSRDARIELAVTPANSSIVYAIVSNVEAGLDGIYKSTNSGSSFSLVFSGTSSNLLGWNVGGDDSGGQGWYDLSIAVSPTDANTVIIGGVNSWRSTNGGSSWSIITYWTSDDYVQTVHADKHMHKYRSNGDLFECNDGGVYFSNDNGTVFTDKSNGLAISQIYKLGVSQTVSGEIITGLQDNGSKVLAGGTWYDVKGGDGMECIIDYTDYNIQYATYTNGQISRTLDEWSTNTDIEPADAGKGAWVTPYIIDPIDHNTLYAGYADVWKTSNKGNSWTKISTMDSYNKLKSMAISSDASVLYVADDDNIWKTSNGGTNWSNITGSLPVTYSYIKYIAVKDGDANTVWVTLSGYNSNAVYESNNGGSTWTNISTGLPQLPAYTIVQNKQATTENHLYVGTELGIYFKKGNDNWIEYNTSLPNVKIGELEIYYDSNPANSKLRAATYGRGLWESALEQEVTDLPSVLTTTPTDITGNSATIGGNITSEGASSVTERGVVWNTSSNPTVANNKIVVSGNGTGAYTTSISSLSTTTTYHVRAYAISSVGTAYGTNVSFTTLCGTKTLPFTESIDGSSLDCWTSHTEGGAADSWEISVTNNAGGTANELHVTYEQISPAISRVVTPPINTLGIGRLSLSFKHAFDDYDVGVTLRVQSSTDGTNWTNEAWSLASSSDVVVGPETINTTISNNLNNATTYIAFIVDGNLYQFDDWYIDDISLASDSAIITDFSEANKKNIKIYPNPTNGKIYIEGNDIEQVEVINIVGEIVSQNKTDNENIFVDLSSLSKGIYFVKVITDTEIIIEKVVVE